MTWAGRHRNQMLGNRSKGPSPLGPDASSKATKKSGHKPFTKRPNAKRHSGGFPRRTWPMSQSSKKCTSWSCNKPFPSASKHLEEILGHWQRYTPPPLGEVAWLGGGKIHGERKKNVKGGRNVLLYGMRDERFECLCFFFSSTSCNRKVKTKILGALQKKMKRFWMIALWDREKKNAQDRIHLPMCRRSRSSTSRGRDIKLQLTCLKLVFKNLMALSTQPPSQLALIPTSAHQSARLLISIFISTKILLQRPHLEFTKGNLLPSLKRTCPLKK